MELIEVDRILPHEEFSIKKVKTLVEEMVSTGSLRSPIRLEKNRLIVMDGHHRLAAAKHLKLKYVPCELYNYSDVEVWSRRKEYKVTPKLIIERGLSGNLYPYKTTRHKFPGEKVPFNISLNDLK